MNCMVNNCGNIANIQMRFSMIGVPEGREDMVAFEKDPLGEWVFTYCDEHRILISSPVPQDVHKGARFIYPRVEINKQLLDELDLPLGHNPITN